MNNEIIIKNMVCPRCIEAVSQIFNDLDLIATEVQLGKVNIKAEISANQKVVLEKKLEERGFQLLDDKESKIINQIKTIIINQVHHRQQSNGKNFSTLLMENMHYDYSHLSRLFSLVEGQTIERFVLAQKIEKVKELLTYDEMTLSEIAYDMGYSSTAHLSGQFKKVTGMSPTAFKNLHRQHRNTLDQL
jgi:AraC-like DNA-binding protein